MDQIRSLCVYCGSSMGADQRFANTARDLGAALAAGGIELVYGGGHRGLMGVIADAVLAGGGHVVGIIPGVLRDAEHAHQGVSELVVVETMHERKRLMAERADAFAVLPGGIGTLDETFEIISWRQLRLHDKPIFLVDIGGYWQPLVELLDHIVGAGFAAAVIPRLAETVPDIEALMHAIARTPAGHRSRAELI